MSCVTFIQSFDLSYDSTFLLASHFSTRLQFSSFYTTATNAALECGLRKLRHHNCLFFNVNNARLCGLVFVRSVVSSGRSCFKLITTVCLNSMRAVIVQFALKPFLEIPEMRRSHTRLCLIVSSCFKGHS